MDSDTRMIFNAVLFAAISGQQDWHLSFLSCFLFVRINKTANIIVKSNNLTAFLHHFSTTSCAIKPPNPLQE